MTDEFHPPLRGVRVLLVDDHEDSRDLFEHLLQYAGALVMTTSRAQDALPMIGNVDIVVTDLAMPDHSGRWLLSHIEDRGLQLPVIAVTGFGDFRDLVGPGFRRILRKPVDPWELVAAIRLALDL